MVSNRYINREPLPKLLTVLDAVKIGFRGFREKFYEEVCSASLKPVPESLLTIRKENIWLEIVNLVIPTIPHFTRFSPNYKSAHLFPTSVSTLE
jgi:pyruvate formate lyase activating enzyme